MMVSLGEFIYYDLFATKGMEYIFVIGFLLSLPFYWRWIHTSYEGYGFENTSSFFPWFGLPDNLYYHRGHSWAYPEGNLIKVGIDDFAQKLIGKSTKIVLPRLGERLEQGEIGWRLNVDSKVIEAISPVKGEVVAINKKVLENPEIINKDPYGEGWLMAVKPENLNTNLKNLLSGNLARLWLEESIEALRMKMKGDTGVVYQDGGMPVSGMAKALDQENWDKIVREFLLTE